MVSGITIRFEPQRLRNTKKKDPYNLCVSVPLWLVTACDDADEYLLEDRVVWIAFRINVGNQVEDFFQRHGVEQFGGHQ